MYLFKAKNKNTRKWCEIHPKLTRKDTRTGSIDMNTKLVDLVLVSFLLILNLFCLLFYFMLTLNK